MELVGNYHHERSENLEGFFKGVGVPYLVRQMIKVSNPDLEIVQLEDSWTITTKSLMSTKEKKFKLGEEYVESMPGATIKSITKLEDNKLVTESSGEDGNKSVATYEVSEDGILLTMVHVNSGQVAKRYFKRASPKN